MELFVILFVIAFAAVLGAGLARFIRNERSPEVTQRATVKKKRANTQIDPNGVASTTLTLTFQIGDEKLTCGVSGTVYRTISENSSGMLTHQGTRFRRFVCDDGTVVEK